MESEGDVSMWNKKEDKPINKRPLWFWPVILAGAALLLELFVFNFRWVQSLGYQTYSPTIHISDSLTPLGNNRYRYEGGTAYIEMTGLNMPVKNLYVGAWYAQDKALSVTVQATDQAHSRYMSLPERKILKAEPKSLYLPLQLTGDSEKIRIDLRPDKDAELVIYGVNINDPVPLFFSVPRLLIVCGALLLLYLLRPSSGLYKVRFSISSYKQLTVILVTAALNCMLFAGFACTNPRFTEVNWAHHFQYQKLAESLAEGKFYLKDEPPEELARIENPYNPDDRAAALEGTGKGYAWDTAYYNGKYYV